MGTERLLRLRLPRIVTGTVGRSSKPERVAVWDDVPVRIREAGPRDGTRVIGGANQCVVAFDGRLYIRAAEHPGGPERAWAQLADGAAERFARALRDPRGRHATPEGGLFPWSDGLDGASRRRGWGPASDVAFRSIEDDGLAEQSRKAQRLADRLVADGRFLYALASIPRLQVEIGHHNPVMQFTSTHLPWRYDAAGDEPWGPFDFPLERRSCAIALMDRLGDREWGYDRWRANYDRHRMIDPGTYAACLPIGRDLDADALAGIAGGVIEALRPHLGALPVAQVERWVALSRLREGGDVPGLRGWLDEARAARDDLAASGALAPPEHGDPEHPLVRLDACILRYEEIERPRLHLDRDGDEAALLRL